MSERVPCPRCGQDYLQHVALVALRRRAVRCPECDALWLTPGDVSSDAGYGVAWFDFGTYLRSAGRSSPHDPGEVRVIGGLLSRTAQRRSGD